MRLATSAMIHQSGRASPGAGRKGRWREMRRSELVTVPSFSPQAAAGRLTWAWRMVSVAASHVGDDDERAGLDRRLDGVGVRHRIDRIGRHDPQRLDAPVGDGTEHVDRLQARISRNGRRAPEALHALAMRGVFDIHMRGKHVGEAADLAPAHGIGLAGDRERPHAGLADAAGRQMAVDDGVDLVGAGGRLVDALAEDGDGLLRLREQREEARDCLRHRGPSAWQYRARSRPRRRGKRALEAAGVCRRYRRGRARALCGEECEQAEEQRDVAVRLDGQMQVGDVGGHGAARIDQHDPHLRPLLLGRGDALVEHRMAPGEVRADQHDEVGELQILVAAGHRVRAEGAAMAGDRRGHAQARIGVDIGRADEALHQLVGDVVVFGQQLARDIEGDGVRAVLARSSARTVAATRSSAVSQSTRAPPISGWSSRSSSPSVSAKRRALGTQTPEIGRMLGVAANAHLAVRGDLASTPQPTPQ